MTNDSFAGCDLEDVAVRADGVAGEAARHEATGTTAVGVHDMPRRNQPEGSSDSSRSASARDSSLVKDESPSAGPMHPHGTAERYPRMAPDSDHVDKR